MRAVNRAAAADQLIFAVQLQRHVTFAGDVHRVFCRGTCVHLQVPQDDVQRVGTIVDDLDHMSCHRACERSVLLSRSFIGHDLIVGFIFCRITGRFFGSFCLYHRLFRLHVGVGLSNAVIDHGAILGFGHGGLRLCGRLCRTITGRSCRRSGLFRCSRLVGSLVISGFFCRAGLVCPILGRGVLGAFRCRSSFFGVVLAGSSLCVVAGDNDVICAVAIVCYIFAIDLDAFVAIFVNNDIDAALTDITDIGS